jgi:hypothetical protein
MHLCCGVDTRFFEVDTGEQKSWTVQLIRHAAVDADKRLPKAAAQLSPGLEAAVPLDRRIALVIGNSAYQNAPQLTNPINDANLISDALKADGFTVTTRNDLDREGFIKELRAFATAADTADWARRLRSGRPKRGQYMVEFGRVRVGGTNKPDESIEYSGKVVEVAVAETKRGHLEREVAHQRKPMVGEIAGVQVALHEPHARLRAAGAE